MTKNDVVIDQLSSKLRQLAENIQDIELKEKDLAHLREEYSKFQYKNLTLLNDLKETWYQDVKMNHMLDETMDQFQRYDNQLEDQFWEESQRLEKERSQLIEKEAEAFTKRQQLILEGSDS